jgi:C-methyltransferase C-terminal domain/Methyltransferase domain
MSVGACPACGATEAEAVVDLTGVPVMCGVLWPTRSEAVAAAQGDLRLVACGQCSMLRNAAFDPGLVDYEGDYDNSLHFSPTFQLYADTLAKRLVDRYGIRNGDVVEIGSGKGDFLRMICDIGDNRGWGYDPTYTGEQAGHDDKVTFIADYFDGDMSVVPELVCCRHVLEHLVDPGPLFDSVRRSAEDTTILYVEVPDASYVLTPAGLWDLIYPHVGYYTAAALRHLVARSGFEPLEVATSFGDQYLWVEARATGTSAAAIRRPQPPADEVEATLGQADGFAELHRKTIASWAAQLAEAKRTRQHVALWGAGTKGVTFLNVVPGASDIHTVVDVNPRKHGRFIPGTGHQVVGPEALLTDRPDVVLVMNNVYEDEIRRALADLGLNATVAVV